MGQAAAMAAHEREKILVIDDTAAVRSTVMRLLSESGFETVGAADGVEGLAEIERSAPDLILCDLRMPRMDGIELLGVVRGKYPDLPVIVMSGAGLLDDAIDALRLGAVDYVEKPIVADGLAHSVRKALEHARLVEENRRYRASLEKMNLELRTTLHLLAEDEEAGRQIQLRMLPGDHQRFGSFEFSRELVPSTFLSGDFVDAFVIDEDRWGFYLADVAGHGVSSALVTVLLRTFVHRQVDDYVRGRDELILHPAKLLEHLNVEMSRADLDKHLTIFCGVIDNRRNCLVYANGGHFPWPLLFDGTSTVALEQPAIPIGLVPTAHYRERQLGLPNDLVLAAFSDGLLDLLPQHDLAEKEAYLRVLFGRPDVTVQGVKDTLQVDRRPGPPDDVAILLIKRGNGDGYDTARAPRMH